MRSIGITAQGWIVLVGVVVGARALCCRSFLVTFFAETRGNLLQHAYLEQRTKVVEATSRDKDVLNRPRRVLERGFGTRKQGRRQRGFRDVVSGDDFERGGFVIAQADGQNYSFVAQSIHLDEIFHG